jgi:ketosteroid isomerase-like protein
MINAALPAVHRLFEAINSRDLSCLDELVTTDFVDHGSPFPLPPGPEGYRQVLTFVSQVLDTRYEVLDELVTSDRIAVRAAGHGRGVAEVHGPGTDGKPYTMHTAHFFRTEAERVAEHWGVRDELSVLVQLGVLPSPYPDRIPGREPVTS